MSLTVSPQPEKVVFNTDLKILDKVELKQIESSQTNTSARLNIGENNKTMIEKIQTMKGVGDRKRIQSLDH